MAKDYKYYEKFLDKVRTSQSFDEIICLHDMFRKIITDPVELGLIDSLIDEKRYKKMIEINKFCWLINDLYKVEHDQDIIDLIDDMRKMTDDKAQLNTINRIAKLKGFLTNSNLYHKNTFKNKIRKRCPHCGNISTEYEGTEYTICGYSNRGYDWKGCGFDWCFKCGKKLCKCWDLDQLFNKLNRFHDKRCCKTHAFKTNGTYPNDYCQCKNIFVRRN